MRRTLGLIVAAAAGVLSPLPAAAQDHSIWALVINEEPKGDVDVVLTPEGPWVDPASIIAAGLLSLPSGPAPRLSRRKPPREC